MQEFFTTAQLQPKFYYFFIVSLLFEKEISRFNTLQNCYSKSFKRISSVSWGHYTDDDVVGVTPLCAGDKARVTLGPAIYHFITTGASARIKW